MVQVILSLAVLFSFPLTAHGQTTTVVSLQRVNYKPEKRLVYDVSFDATSCQLNREDPFDAYYRDNQSGQRLEKFSKESIRYFGPRLEGVRIGSSEVPLQFQALTEMQDKLGIRAQILVRLERVDGKCVPSAEITYANRRFTLEKITLKMKKALGIPSGVEWVHVKGRNDNGTISECVAGKCE